MVNPTALPEYSSDFFILRTPSLPLKFIYDIHQKILSGDEYLSLYDEIKKLFSNHAIQEAILLASPVLYREFEKISNNDCAKEFETAVISLYKYLNRMAYRCTPFGMFAGCNQGIVSENETAFDICSITKAKRHVRLDMDFLSRLANQIFVSQPKEIFCYYTNSSIYRIGKKYRYIETIFHDNIKTYKIAGVDKNGLLELLLAFCIKKQTYNEILNFIKNLGIPDNHAINYLNELVDSQLLIHEMGPNATGNEYMHNLLEIIKGKNDLRTEYDILNKILSDLESGIDFLSISKLTKPKLEQLVSGANESHLYQLDLNKVANCCNLNNNLVKQIKEACFITAQLSIIDHAKSRLGIFKKAFEERYETALVKLTDVLDVENGLDYHALHNQQSEQFDNRFFDRNNIAAYKFEKYNEALKNRSLEIVIQESDLSGLTREILLPDSFSALVVISKQPTTGEEFIRFKYASGPSGANMIGRFCHSNPSFETAVTALIKKEETLLQPGQVLAEIAHIPQSRVGNVIARPHLTKYEIPFLSLSDIPTSDQIAIDDLYLQLKNKKLVLYSKRLKKEVVPRLSNAHNFSQNNLQIYHFLCDLKNQDLQAYMGWNWDMLTDQEFLPRVRYKSTILSPATWNLNKKHLSFFDEKNEETWKKSLGHLRTALNIPDRVSFLEGDNEILLDLRLDISNKILQKAYKKNKQIKFTEPSVSLESATVIDDLNEIYANELVVPFYKNVEPTTGLKANKPIFSKTKRTFSPGSEWVYFQIYTGIVSADKILTEILTDFTQKMLRRKIVDKWFYLRYSDPRFHLRVRFHLIDVRNIGLVIREFSSAIQPMITSNEINDLSIKQYRREIERYGEKTMETAETLFHFNTACTTSFLKHLNRPDYETRMFFAVTVIDRLLSAFRLDLKEKLSFFQANRNTFAKQFQLNTDKNLKVQISELNRKNQGIIAVLLESYGDWESDLTMVDIIKNHTANVASLADSIRNELEAQDFPSLFGFLSSLIHMFVNRLMQSNNNFYEFLIYEYLERGLRSVIGKSKKII